MSTDTNWLVRSKPQPTADCRLLCLPYAGGSASLFHDWPIRLPELDVLAVQPPGRANRLAEPAYREMEPYIEDLLQAVLPQLDRRWMLFGHSMGALAGYALLQRLHADGQPLPSHFFISAARGPQVKERIRPISHLEDDDFILELKKLNGTPPEVLENRELIQFCLPFIRADFKVIEGYLIESFDPLPVKPVMLCGMSDEIKAEEMQAWNKLFQYPGELNTFSGDHFFLHEESNSIGIIEIIRQGLDG